MNTEAVNPIIQKARWVCAKIKLQGIKRLSPEERLFITELNRRSACHDDRTARRLVSQIHAAALEFNLTLPCA